MKTHAVDRLVLTARKGSLMELSGPAWQAVSWGGGHIQRSKIDFLVRKESAVVC